MHHPTRHRGYTLLLTLLLLAIMAASVAALARTSLEAALEASDGERNLKRRWAALSAQQVLADLGPRILARRFAEYVATQDPSQAVHPIEEAPPSTIQDSVALGGLEIEFVFTDEQARFNFNRALLDADGDVHIAQRRLADSFARHLPGVLDGATVALRPLDEDLAFSLDLPRLPSPGSVFESNGPGSTTLITSGSEIKPDWASHLTTWGNGQLRLNLASDPALRILCEPMLAPDEIETLLDFRGETPAVTVLQLLRWLPLRAAQRAWLRQRLTDASSTYSLRMTIHDGQRRWERLAVIETDRTDGAVRYATEWRP